MVLVKNTLVLNDIGGSRVWVPHDEREPIMGVWPEPAAVSRDSAPGQGVRG